MIHGWFQRESWKTAESVKNCDPVYVRMYARVCFKRCRGVDKWVDDDPAAGQSEYIDAHVHTAVKENGRRGRFSGGALMRMLLIIQFVNSRYILIVLAEPRVTRITPCFMPSDFLSSVILRFSSFPRADLSLPISSLSRKMLTRGIEIRAKIDENRHIWYLPSRKKEGVSLSGIPSSSIFEKDISKCAEKWKRRDERVGLMNFFFSAVLFLTAKVDRYFRPIP